MKLIFILLALIPFVAFAAERCISGTISKPSIPIVGSGSLGYTTCTKSIQNPDDTCYRYLDQTNSYVMGCETNSECEARKILYGSNNVTCCIANICNAPPGIWANKDATLMTSTVAQMRSIMYTVMGSIFIALWVVFAFLLGAIPSFVLVVLGVVDVVIAYFLIFVPAAHFLGLYFVLLGVATIASELHLKDKATQRWVILGSIVGFLLIGGLTFIPFTTTPYMNSIANANCVNDLGLNENPDPFLIGIPTRCENYLLFVLFCVYLLILMQPFKIMLAFKHAAGAVADKDVAK